MASDSCDGFFTETMLRNSLTSKILSKFDEALANAALKDANIDNVINCHGEDCHFKAQMQEDAGIILKCPDCGKETCKLCGEAGHIPLKCQESKDAKINESKSKGRRQAEEAMTMARIRTCGNCGNTFIKSDGCNKITCRCGRLICYVCRQDITKLAYQHYCQKFNCDHKACRNCPLYTDTAEDDKRAIEEAGLAALRKERNETELGGALKVNVIDVAKEEAEEAEIKRLLAGNDLDATIQSKKRQNEVLNARNHFGIAAALDNVGMGGMGMGLGLGPIGIEEHMRLVMALGGGRDGGHRGRGGGRGGGRGHHYGGRR
jgi:hypothetical protein